MELQIITSDSSPVCLNKKANRLDENEYRWGVSASPGFFSALFWSRGWEDTELVVII